MAARLTAFLPRLVALTVIWLLGAATYTLAADTVAPPPPASPAASASKPHVLVVPDVRRKAYVFAKGILQDAGFAWRVEGSVKGYSANTVTVQNPAPGTKVVDNGAPVVVLGLARNSAYGESGQPENTAPYKGTSVGRCGATRSAAMTSVPPAIRRPVKAATTPRRRAAAKRNIL